MPVVNVRMEYESQEPGAFTPTRFILEKSFTFNYIPTMECIIILKKDAINYINFKNVAFDPENGEYNTIMHTHENVERYYGSDPIKKMKPVLDRYKQFGWNITGSSIPNEK